MNRKIWCWLMTAWLCSTAWAGPFTLPFSSSSIPIWQGFYYDDGSYHGGLDYGAPTGTPILAVDDGYAWAWDDFDPYNPYYCWGRYVAVYHASCNCYTLYAHLGSQASFIPRAGQSTYPNTQNVKVKRGQVIGWSGNSGTIEPHLHFETTIGGLAPGGQRVDPYGLFTTHWSYPGCGNNGGNYYYWTQCPPVVPASIPTCTSPGPFVDIAKAGDFDGNNKDEFARFFNDPGRWDVALSNGSGFGSLRQWMCGLGINSVSQLIGDVNGDNRDDATIIDLNSNGNAYVSTSTGTKFADFYQAGSNIMRNMTNRFMADINGDRKDDVVGWAPSGKWYVALSNGFTFGAQFYTNLSYGVNSSKRLVADVNGDKRSDAIMVYPDGTWVVALGQSNGTFGSPRNWDMGFGSGASTWFVADINGDGRSDAISFWNNVSGWQGTILVHESTGSAFAGTNTPRAIGHGTNSSKQLFGDFTGDGKADFAFYFASSGWWVSRCDGWGFLPPQQW